MKIVNTKAELSELTGQARFEGRRVGFVPTMGFLHDGHMSLVRQARKENDTAVVSIFVNPTQFGPREDFDDYPRDADRDAALLTAAHVDVLFAPTAEEMYPPAFSTHVDVGALGTIMCGASRPGHFRGVATVVAKLLGVVGPCTAYFGMKDYQQLIVIKRMVEDLDLPVVVVGSETVREPDGLAMSSRNAYLTETERALAPALYEALNTAARAVGSGEREAATLVELALGVLREEPMWRVEYLDVRDADTLGPVERVEGPVVIAAAAWLGKARLIDNVVVAPPA